MGLVEEALAAVVLVEVVAPVVEADQVEAGSQRAPIEKYISLNGELRAAAVVATEVIQDMQSIHNSLPIGTAALGRAIIGAGLLASFLKNSGARISLHFKGDGPLGTVFAEGDESGAVRGFLINPQVHLPSKNGKLNVGSGVGKGTLTVATSVPTTKQPYSGSVEIQTGEIGEDIAYYLYQSQQIPSIVALGVFVETDHTVSAAGGVLVQLMPGAKEETIGILEKQVKKMRSVTEMVKAGLGPSQLVQEVLGEIKFRKLEIQRDMHYGCSCNITKVERSLILMGPGEIEILIQKNEPAQVTCDFCGRKYYIDQKTLSVLKDASKK